MDSRAFVDRSLRYHVASDSSLADSPVYGKAVVILYNGVDCFVRWPSSCCKLQGCDLALVSILVLILLLVFVFVFVFDFDFDFDFQSLYL